MTINTMTHYAWAIIIVSALGLFVSFYWKHTQYIKDQIANIKRHKKLFAFTALVTLGLIYVFHANYTFQNPVVSRSEESYVTVWNERAACLTSLAQVQLAEQAMNK